MSMTREAAGFYVRKLQNSPRRFPTFLEPGHDFHAPAKPVVECVYRSGKIEKLKVTPEAPTKDVVLFQ